MTRSLRILVAHNVSFSRPGGMNRIMRHIHDRVVRAGHQVEYFCAEDAPASARGRWARFTFPLAVRRRVRDALRTGRPYDIVNVHEPISAPVSGRAGSANTRVVVTSHGVERRAWELALEERRLGRAGPSWRTRFTHASTILWPSERGLRHADAVVCLNEEDRRFLQDRYGIAPDRIVRMYPGVDEVFAAAASGRDYGRADRILFAGTWRKNKGIEDMVPAFARLAAVRPLLTLTVAGAGVAAHVVHDAFPLDVRSRVTCVDTLNEDVTARLFAEHDLYVLPSLFEGTPLTLLEAMMSGLPIVTTNTCGMKDVIAHDVNGLLIPIRSPDAIVAALGGLIDRPADRARLGLAAQTAARDHYSWDRAAGSIVALYERLRSPQGNHM